MNRLKIYQRGMKERAKRLDLTLVEREEAIEQNVRTSHCRTTLGPDDSGLRCCLWERNAFVHPADLTQRSVLPSLSLSL